MEDINNISDPLIAYDSVDDRNIIYLINAIRQGIKFNFFVSIANNSPFSMVEWSAFLHISERTMQRYKKEKRTFDLLQSEKILQIALLYKMGTDIFGSKEKLHSWLEAENIALGKIKPKELLDNAFGIGLLKDELTRIEQGVLA